MRLVHAVKLALLDLLTSGCAAVLLMLALRGLVRHAQEGDLLDELMPAAARKPVCAILIAVILCVLWLGARSVGRGRGAIIGATIWLARTGLWWGIVALTVFAGVALDGAFTHSLADLNWPFALGCLAVSLAILVGCAFAWRRASTVVAR